MKTYTLSILLLSLTFAGSLSAQVPAPGEPQTRPVLLLGGTAHLGNGDVIENAAITFAQGKITSVGQVADAPQDTAAYEVIRTEGKHIYPGFILPNTDLGLVEIGAVDATVDEEEVGTLNPNVRSLISYNTDSELIPTMRYNGILLAQITPAGNMIPGTSSIVQLDAWNWEDAAVVEDDAVHIHWPGRYKMEFDFATFTVNRVPNENYEEQVREVENLFTDAATYREQNDPKITNLKLKAMTGLFDGNKALYIHSDEVKEIIESIKFGEAQGVKKMVLVSSTGAYMARDFLKEKNIPVIITNLHILPERTEDDVSMPYQLPQLLTEAGLLVGLGYERDMVASARNLAFLAGTAAAYGLGKEQALQLITGNNAKILGIDDQAGTLEKGKRAILFVSGGDALDMRTNMVERAFVDGRKVTLPAMQQRLYQKYKEKYAADE